MNSTIEIGSKVKPVGQYLRKFEGRTGTVVKVEKDYFLDTTQYLVDFGDGFQGHDGHGFIKNRKTFWYLFEHEIKLVSNKKGNAGRYV